MRSLRLARTVSLTEKASFIQSGAHTIARSTLLVANAALVSGPPP